MQCVFCAIAAQQLTAERISEDEHFIVLRDIFPLRPAHVLIVSREHAPFLKDLCVAACEHLLALAQRLACALRAAGCGEQGINVLINDGPASNQHLPHLQLHLMPRRSGDTARLLWRALTRFLPLARKRIDARLQQEAQQLREALSNV
jgi:histidine triad (HIT) family protein